MGETSTAAPPASVKVVVTGPFAAGKTTLIRSLSDINVLTTERAIATAGPGGTDTVPLDFGRMAVDTGLSVQLFGTPGHADLDFLWEIVADGLLGFIVVVDDSRPDTMELAMEMLGYFRSHADVPHVVAVNHVSGDPERAVRRTRHSLRIAEEIRVLPVDARDHTSARRVLLELFYAAQESIGGNAPTTQAV